MVRNATNSFIDGTVHVQNQSAEFDFIVPAFIDIHCHGGGGKYFSEDPEIARNLHYASGTKVQLASLISQPIEVLELQINKLRNTDIFGVHLEGPYISREFSGAHNPNHLKAIDLGELSEMIEVGAGLVKMVTLAPELPEATKAIEFLVSRNIIAAIGHSNADRSETLAAIAAGATVVTHFNNAMKKVPTSDCLSEVALDSELFLELICDGVHIPSEQLISFMDAASSRVLAVTDAMAAAGCADGDYSIGDMPVTVSKGVAKLKDTDTLAGSTLTMLQVFLNLVKLCGLERAVAATSLNPARLLGLNPYAAYIGIKGEKVTYL